MQWQAAMSYRPTWAGQLGKKTMSMRYYWYLKFSDDNDIEQELELFDAKSFFGGYLKLKRSYFDSLVKNIKMTKTYITSKAIEKVIGPDN